MLDLVLPRIKARTGEGNMASYEIAPVDAGYSVSLANAMRRILLSSLEGAAITSVLIEGVQHEFQDILYVKEDVTDIVQQLKKIRLRSYANRAVHIHLDMQGEGKIRASDIRTPGTIEIMNPDLHIATLDNANAHLVMDMTVGTGRGFVEASAQAEQRSEGQPLGVILTDAIYSPVCHVNFTLSPISVGRMEKLDRIELSITTDGTISPDEALRQSADILRRQFGVFAAYWRKADVPAEQDRSASHVPIPLSIYELSIDDLDLSVRTYNSLKRHAITTAGQVLETDGDDLKMLRNIGEKTLKELSDCFKKKGLFPKEGDH